jgi:hypothetical protein
VFSAMYFPLGIAEGFVCVVLVRIFPLAFIKRKEQIKRRFPQTTNTHTYSGKSGIGKTDSNFSVRYKHTMRRPSKLNVRCHT